MDRRVLCHVSPPRANQVQGFYGLSGEPIAVFGRIALYFGS
jgi:hypothetical protein